MKCQACNKREATVHFTEIEGKTKKEVHLCEECAREKTGALPKQASLGELFLSLIQQQGKENLQMLKSVCPHCGISYLEFKTSGRLGCAKDYENFEKGLMPLIERLHQSTQHVGKIPSRGRLDAARENELLQFRRELESAIRREDYERAAELRDRIRALTGMLDENRRTDKPGG